MFTLQRLEQSRQRRWRARDASSTNKGREHEHPTDSYALQRPPALLILATRPMAVHLMTERRDGAVAGLRRAGQV